MANTCKNCGAPIPDGAEYCGQCNPTQGIPVAQQQTMNMPQAGGGYADQQRTVAKDQRQMAAQGDVNAAPEQKPFYKKPWFIVAIIVVAILIIGGLVMAFGGNKSATTQKTTVTVVALASASPSPSPSASPTASAPAVSPSATPGKSYGDYAGTYEIYSVEEKIGTGDPQEVEPKTVGFDGSTIVLGADGSITFTVSNNSYKGTYTFGSDTKVYFGGEKDVEATALMLDGNASVEFGPYKAEVYIVDLVPYLVLTGTDAGEKAIFYCYYL